VVDFTGQNSAIDQNGHGTFVAGILSSTNPECLGIAPDAEIYILKLFTDDNITYSSWFIDAFNFVLDNNIDIVNLSTATKDSQDVPFMEKINELTAAGVIIISAIGNDGPTPGSAENPGDMPTVIGVGSLNANLDDVAYFSSRGMTKTTLLNGFGVPKPDLLLPGENILSLGLNALSCDMK
jgi:membrane-bound transcription factor site-1 protease